MDERQRCKGKKDRCHQVTDGDNSKTNINAPRKK